MANLLTDFFLSRFKSRGNANGHHHKKTVTTQTANKPSQTAKERQTAANLGKIQQEQLAQLFHRGWDYLSNQQWRLAEKTFAKIEAQNAQYEQEGVRASYLRQKAQYEQEAEAAWEAGNLEEALVAYKKADDFEHVKHLYELLQIRQLETRAENLAGAADYQEAAWIYDHLLNEFPEHEKETFWQIKKAGCWEAELSPHFNRGIQAMETHKWREAYEAFTQVLIVDPYFQKHGRSAADMADTVRRKVVAWADEALRQGNVQQALDAYREVGHFDRIKSVHLFLRLRKREEARARKLEAAGKWQAAAAKYHYLRTLYYDENGRAHWRAAELRCLEESRLQYLYGQAMTAMAHKKWDKAKSSFTEILTIRPDYHPGKKSVRQLYRAAWWRSLTNWLTARIKSSSPPPQIQT